MAKRKAIATLIEYETNFGKSTTKPVRLYATLCVGENPQIFEITLPDKRSTRQRSIVIRRSQIEAVLNDNH